MDRKTATRRALPYFLAAACVGAASAAQFLFASLISGFTNFGVFYPAVLVSALLGIGPGVFAAVASVLTAWFYFLPPRWSFSLQDPSSALRLTIFSICSTLVIAAAEAYRRAQASRNAANQLFKTVQDISVEGVVVYRAVRDRSGQVIDFEYRYANPAAVAIMARSDPDRVIGAKLLERLPMAREHPQLFPRYLQVLTTGETSQAEYEIGAHWYSSTVAKLEDGIVVTVQDVTARHRSDEIQTLLAQELNHRVKNMLASVIAMTSFTGLGASSAEEFRDKLLGRFYALSRAHGLLVSSAWTDAMVDEVVRSTLEPHLQSDPTRFAIEGPPVAIAPDTALALNMALHELATNAVKYGALSGPRGEVAIRWLMDMRQPGFVRLTWLESGGPRIEGPSGRGFGMRLLERAFAVSEGGAAKLEFLAGGVACELRFKGDLPTPQPDDAPAEMRGAGPPKEDLVRRAASSIT